jgi:hypothetical protein
MIVITQHLYLQFSLGLRYFRSTRSYLVWGCPIPHQLQPFGTHHHVKLPLPRRQNRPN